MFSWLDCAADVDRQVLSALFDELCEIIVIESESCVDYRSSGEREDAERYEVQEKLRSVHAADASRARFGSELFLQLVECGPGNCREVTVVGELAEELSNSLGMMMKLGDDVTRDERSARHLGEVGVDDDVDLLVERHVAGDYLKKGGEHAARGIAKNRFAQFLF